MKHSENIKQTKNFTEQVLAQKNITNTQELLSELPESLKTRLGIIAPYFIKYITDIKELLNEREKYLTHITKEQIVHDIIKALEFGQEYHIAAIQKTIKDHYDTKTEITDSFARNFMSRGQGVMELRNYVFNKINSMNLSFFVSDPLIGRLRDHVCDITYLSAYTSLDFKLFANLYLNLLKENEPTVAQKKLLAIPKLCENWKEYIQEPKIENDILLNEIPTNIKKRFGMFEPHFELYINDVKKILEENKDSLQNITKEQVLHNIIKALEFGQELQITTTQGTLSSQNKGKHTITQDNYHQAVSEGLDKLQEYVSSKIRNMYLPTVISDKLIQNFQITPCSENSKYTAPEFAIFANKRFELLENNSPKIANAQAFSFAQTYLKDMENKPNKTAREEKAISLIKLQFNFANKLIQQDNDRVVQVG